MNLLQPSVLNKIQKNNFAKLTVSKSASISQEEMGIGKIQIHQY